MLLNHPYVHEMHIQHNDLPGGENERVLVVQTRMSWASEYSVSNDNRLLMELSEQVRRLEKLARIGIMDFDRVDVVPVDLN